MVWLYVVISGRGSDHGHYPVPEYVCFGSSLPLPVAIYLGIKKRPSPGPSDVAGIWGVVGGGTLRRWYWLCGRRHLDVAARSTMLAPFCSPAPTAWRGAAWLSRLRCATFPQAPLRLLTGCVTRDSGGHRQLFGTLPLKSLRTLNFEGVFVYECVFVSVCVCAKKGGLGVEIIQWKKPRRGEGLDPRVKTSPSVSFIATWPTPPPLHTLTHTHTDKCTHTWPVKSKTEALPLHPTTHLPSSANYLTEQLHPLDLDQREPSWIFLLLL